MTPKDRLGDRRSELRFEIIGDLWATLVTTQSLPIVNVGAGGMLIESAGPLPVGSLQRFRLNIADDLRDVTATVRHVTAAPGRPDRYLVGLAFVDLPMEAHDWLQSVARSSSIPAGTVGEA